MKRETFAKAAERVVQAINSAPQEPERPDHMCAAWGCPMWGSVGDGGHKRWCRFHVGLAGEEGDSITRRLNIALDAVQEEQAMRTALVSGRPAIELRDRLRAAEKRLAVVVYANTRPVL